MEERVLATANQRADRLKHMIRTGSPQTFGVLNRKWIVGNNGEVYHYQYYDPRNRELNSLSVFEFDPQTHALEVAHVRAKRARYEPVAAAAARAEVALERGLVARVRSDDAGQQLRAASTSDRRRSSPPTISSPRRASPS